MSVGEVIVERVQGVWVFTLRGEHDISIEPTFQRRLEQAFDAGSTVIVDLSEVEFMDSSGVALLLHAAARAGSVHLRQPSSIVRRIIEITGLTDVLHIDA